MSGSSSSAAGSPTTGGRWSAIWQWVRPYSGGLIVLLISLLVQMAFYAALPVSFSYIIDSALPNSDWLLLRNIFIYLGVGAVAFVIAGLVQDRLMARLVAGFIRDLRARMFQQLQRMSSHFFTTSGEADIISRFSGDIATVEGLLITVVPAVIQPAMQVILNTILLFLFDWRLACFSLLVWPVCLAGPLIYGGRAVRTSFNRKEEETNAVTEVQQNVTAHQVIRTFSLSRMFGLRFKQSNDLLYVSTTQLHESSFQAQRLAEIGVVVLQMLVICVGALLVLKDWLSVGVLVAFQALFLELSDSLCGVVQSLPQFVQTAGSARRVNELLLAPAAVVESPKAKALDEFRDSITLENVSWSYDGKAPHLSDLSLTIPKGTTVAIVGPSGCGKSTVLNLLMRQFDPDRGSVRIDGRPIAEYTQESLRAHMAPVLQDTYVFFNSPIRENIRIGRLDATDQEVEDAARAAGIDPFIAELPEKYDTILGPRAARLTGEQRLRLAIARAWLRNPPILLLDEATSALDAAAEAAAGATLDELRRGRTVVLATHRLSHTANADCIFFLEGGRIVESGSHEDLLELGGRYAALWEKQSGFVIEGNGDRVRVAIDRLRAIPILSRLGPELLGRLATRLNCENSAPGRTIVQEGDPGDKFYIIARGKAEAHKLTPDGARMRLTVMGDGDFFGELALLRNSPRTASVTTLAACSFLTLTRTHFLDLLEAAPGVREEIEQVVAQRR
jgi:ATP-binding cassette subfamily B protein